MANGSILDAVIPGRGRRAAPRNDGVGCVASSSHSVARRRFLGSALGTTLGLLAPGATVSPAQDRSNALLAVAYEDSGQRIASDFIGLSYESASLAASDYFTPDNASILGLVRLLGPDGVIRIGGNTSERTVWNAEPIAPDAFAIWPASIDR